MKKGIWFGFMLLILCCVTGFAQQNKKRTLESDRIKTMEEIELTSKLIEETKAKSKESLSELNLVNHKIKVQQRLIVNLNDELELLDEQMMENNASIKELEERQERIRKSYANSIYLTYKKRKRENFMLYVLASDNMNQAYKRFRYMQIINAYRKKQVDMMKEMTKQINAENEKIAQMRVEKQQLQGQHLKQTDLLAGEENKQRILLQKLKQKEKELKAELERKKKIARELEKEIERIIAEERKKSAKGNIYATLTKEEKLISDEFGKNYGKLPWPTKQGIVVGKFGEQEHASMKGIKVRNDGIYIATVKNAEVRAIFKGVVTKVFAIPGSNYTVIIRHGNYYTLYHNLSNVMVAKGTEVATKQTIGNVATDLEKNETIVHFQVWKETERNDPELWLSR